MRRAARRHFHGSGTPGFTLLEVLLVLTILGFLGAMIYPAVGLLNNRERERITQAKMEEIRRAIVGDPDRFDEAGRRIIGGYVGDMGEWPDLWEARAEIKPGFTGYGWDNPGNMSSGLGQGPDYAMNPANVYFRPSGHFVKGRWQWHRPFRKLSNDTVNNYDHIGGLATENEGQPRGLWTRTPEELPTNLGTAPDIYSAPGEDLGDRWRGPYLLPPVNHKPEAASHYAATDAEYAQLAPTATGPKAWEDGDYTALAGGEHFDEKEAFRLLQTDDRLADGWNRALRFFITDDPDQDGETIFWILSEGADGRATYPTKGDWTGGNWIINEDDTMAREFDPDNPDLGGYNPKAPENLDNIIMKIHSSEWRAIFAEQNRRKRQQTEVTLAAIRRALVGTDTPAEGGFNSGFTGAMCRLPKLFHWRQADLVWDDATDEEPPVPYTKGQPRELWTARPYTADPAHELDPPAWGTWGIGWQGPYLPPPFGAGEKEILRDGWGREILFFRDETNNSLLVLSRGEDGRFDFGDDLDPTEPVDVTTYDPADPDGWNADNLVLRIDANHWQGARLTLHLTVLNATPNVTKAMVARGLNDSGDPLTEILTAPDDLPDDWHVPSAFTYDATTDPPAISGTRQLVIWDDTNNNNQVDSDEDHIVIPLTLHVHKDLDNTLRYLTIDADSHFPREP
ncbi:prepilin-type N-terminal cleavage/methylation domain-containing protein [Desulfobulbus alkaliphilus]|uniref:prepilin-type N-terminal cleavage/methylation domain-containing protein n=1 Tax=Desulfobulbus alkaliphilus TaxID=869814 RepID=UPI0019630C1E|nr:prepilin-type N-terminal cleavage/methylation domain-containing protein [Desulfobulbus alkaliphilus]MBM9536572.1 prepilin-type N-terminal cleavage/methylation domain-containing protein [Desulfobulbus alkaliphilus]